MPPEKSVENSTIEDDYAFTNIELYDRNFNRILDRYLCEGSMTEDEWVGLTPKQRDVIQCFKRAIKRISKQ